MQAVVEDGHVLPRAIADSEGEALTEARRIAPKALTCRTFDELLEQDLDGVVIATPSAMHADQAMAALQRGMAVFCQKPLGRSAPETRAVLDAARQADRLLGVDLSYRHVRGVQLMRQRIQDGDIGDVFAVRAVFHNAFGPGKPWFYDRNLSGGGCLIDLGIHLVDLILWTLAYPDVDRVTSKLYTNGKAFHEQDQVVEDYAAAMLELSNGAIAEVACSWNLSTGCDAVIELCFHGTRGSLCLENINGSYFDFRVEQYTGRSREMIAGPPDEWGGRAICSWAQTLAQRNTYDEEASQLERVANVLDVIYQNGLT